MVYYVSNCFCIMYSVFCLYYVDVCKCARVRNIMSPNDNVRGGAVEEV